MQPLMQAESCIFCLFFLRNEIKDLFYAGFLTKYEVCMSSGDLKVLISLPVVTKTISTQQQNLEIL